jgi:hypothetical protein
MDKPALPVVPHDVLDSGRIRLGGTNRRPAGRG